MPAQLRIAGAVGTANAEGLARTIGKHRSAVAGIPVPLSIGTHGDAVNGVIVALAVEPSEDHLALIDRGIKLPVAVDVGVDDHIRSHRNDHLVADDRHAHGSPERRFLHEHALLIGHAIPIRILQDDDAIASRLTVVVAAVIDPFGHPNSPLRVEVEVRRVLEHWSRGPDDDLEVRIGHLQQVGGYGRFGGEGPSGQGQEHGKAIVGLHSQVIQTNNARRPARSPAGPSAAQQKKQNPHRPSGTELPCNLKRAFLEVPSVVSQLSLF